MRKLDGTRIITDTSAMLSACFKEERCLIARNFFEFVQERKDVKFWVPRCYSCEIFSNLKKATRSPGHGQEAKLTVMEGTLWSEFLYSIVIIDDGEFKPVHERIKRIMHEKDLLYCDTTFLELAERKGCFLVTRDRDLAEAAYEKDLLHSCCEPILYTSAEDLACVDMGEFEDPIARLRALTRI